MGLSEREDLTCLKHVSGRKKKDKKNAFNTEEITLTGIVDH